MKKVFSLALVILLLILVFPFALDYTKDMNEKQAFNILVDGEQNKNELTQRISVKSTAINITSESAIAVDSIEKIVIELNDDVVTTGSAIRLNDVDIVNDTEIFEDEQGRYLILDLKKYKQNSSMDIEIAFAYTGADKYDMTVNVCKSAAIIYDNTPDSASDQTLGVLQYQSFTMGKFRFNNSTNDIDGQSIGTYNERKSIKRHINTATLVDLTHDKSEKSQQGIMDLVTENAKDKSAPKNTELDKAVVSSEVDSVDEINLDIPTDVLVLPKTSEVKYNYSSGVILIGLGMLWMRFKK